MAGNKINTLVDSWKTDAQLNLTGDQEEKVSSARLSVWKKITLCIG